MSSRQEEKEQRKREREARERAAAQAAKRKRRVQIIGGVVAAAVIVGAVLVIAGAGSDKKRDSRALTTAAGRAGCVVRSFPDAGATHVATTLAPADFKTNPPTSGNHNPNPAQDGVYAPGNEPEIGNWVHTLEHGRILFQYKAGTPPGRIAQLQALFNEPVLSSAGGYHTVLMQSNSKMPFAVAGVSWRHFVGCTRFTDQSIAVLRAFRNVYVDTGPEKIP